MLDALLRPDWRYWRIYVPDLGTVTRLLHDVVHPVVAGHREVLRRWFFLQYMDLSGLQLRVRLSARPDAAADVEAELDRRFAERGAEVVKRWYEPELAKFRGPDGVEFAERVAHLGSETALQLLPGRASARRITQAAAHTAAIVEGLPAEQRVSFLHQYAWYWSGRGARTVAWRPAAATARPDDPGAVRQAGRLAGNVARELESEHVGAPLRRYAERFWSEYRESARRVSPYRAAFQHVHLMNNRLGAVPGEEAQIARLLWLQRLRSMN
ncbi:thiopeptide-type bacteriocin biosynthesis protein [Amycolatopsis sp. NPDC051903]|uniref:thiopeptide-type bacteriocin biosynthesis protein n=1 Tax=Amycolatopsis sp. NPDC051903 TaxID=3363936 RepID=UPI0037B5C82C